MSDDIKASTMAGMHRLPMILTYPRNASMARDNDPVAAYVDKGTMATRMATTAAVLMKVSTWR